MNPVIAIRSEETDVAERLRVALKPLSIEAAREGVELRVTTMDTTARA